MKTDTDALLAWTSRQAELRMELNKADDEAIELDEETLLGNSVGKIKVYAIIVTFLQ